MNKHELALELTRLDVQLQSSALRVNPRHEKPDAQEIFKKHLKFIDENKENL